MYLKNLYKNSDNKSKKEFKNFDYFFLINNQYMLLKKIIDETEKKLRVFLTKKLTKLVPSSPRVGGWEKHFP